MSGFWSKVGGMIAGGAGAFGGLILDVFTGGGLKSILRTIDNSFDNETEREAIKADVTKTWIEAQARIVQRRTWWFQLFFVIPLGYWFTWVCIVSVHHNGVVDALPAPLDAWGGYMIMALFVIDGSKALGDSAKAVLGLLKR